MSVVIAGRAPVPVAEADSQPVASPRKVALWIRLTAAIAIALVVAWTVMIYLTYSQRREGSVAQARDFAESVSQLTTATITGLMILKKVDDRGVFLEQMRNSNNIRDLKVLRFGSTIQQFGPGEAAESAVSAEERAAMEAGKPYFRVLDDADELQAVFPVLNSKNHLGKNCMKCHEDRENAVLGAVSMRVSLAKTQADLRDFTLRISLLAAALSIPLLLAIFVLVRRYVLRPLGGEPQEAVQVANRIAAGDLTARVTVTAGDGTSVMAALGRMQDHLATLIGHINQSSVVIRAGVDEVSDGSENLSRRTEAQGASLEETASAMEQLTGTVSANAGNAVRASTLATGAAEVASRGGATIGEVVQTMSSITASSRRVADITGVIDAIAFQTNILALNAAVEAARAGHEGRGFAVVAQEVRMLAQRSAAAAREIKELTDAAVRTVEEGSVRVDEAGRTMEQIVAAVNSVTSIMAEIADASREQRSGIEEVNKAIMQMDHATQQNASLVADTAANLETLKDQAGEMAAAVAAFRLEAETAGFDAN